jgi:hypothetical protein
MLVFGRVAAFSSLATRNAASVGLVVGCRNVASLELVVGSRNRETVLDFFR